MRARRVPDSVFCVRDADGDPCWRAMVGGELVRADFNSKGAAQAAIPVERARRLKRLARRLEEARAARAAGGGAP